MKRITLTLLFITATLSFSLSLAAQDTDSALLHFTEEDIAGRWIETERTENKDNTNKGTIPSIFIFKNDLSFHKGADTEGMIIFDIAGRYKVQGTTIEVVYMDFSGNRPATKARKMTMEVTSYDKNEMRVRVRESRYNNYESVLRRQQGR